MARRERRRVDRCACGSIYDARGRQEPVRVSILVSMVVLSAAGCVWKREPKTGGRRTLQAVALPDLSRLEEPVQAQRRERYATLAAKQQDPGTPAADLGTEYGEMGTLLMAAEFHDPAEASLRNAQA